MSGRAATAVIYTWGGARNHINQLTRVQSLPAVRSFNSLFKIHCCGPAFRHHPLRRTDKILCRCFGAPATLLRCAGFPPDHLITTETAVIIGQSHFLRHSRQAELCIDRHNSRVTTVRGYAGLRDSARGTAKRGRTAKWTSDPRETDMSHIRKRSCTVRGV